MTVSGTTILLYSGETLPISVTVLDSVGEPATNLDVATFAYRKGSSTLMKACTVVGAVVSVAFTQAETLLMEGDYDYEIRVKADDDDVDSVVVGVIRGRPGIVTTAI